MSLTLKTFARSRIRWHGALGAEGQPRWDWLSVRWPIPSSLPPFEAIADESRRRGCSAGHARSSAREALVLAEVLERRHCDGVIL
jgi:hypothetical protein